MIELHVATLVAGPGPLWVAGTRRGVLRVGFGEAPSLGEGARALETHRVFRVRETPGPLRPAVRWLRRFLAGDLHEAPPELDLHPPSTFAARVMEVVRSIPPGQLVTYDAVARAVRSPQGARAVGRVLATNPVPILIPCHRVVTKTGDLAGYVGGRDWKQHLLQIESRQVPLRPGGRRGRR